MKSPLAIMIALALTGAAQAQTHAAADQPILVQLSRTLGESHALRQLCNGAGDQYWRERMKAMLNAEQPDPAFQDTLEAAFNEGFAARQHEFATCNAAARQAQAQVSAKGQALSRRLAKSG